jgi:hypothetical protein
MTKRQEKNKNDLVKWLNTEIEIAKKGEQTNRRMKNLALAENVLVAVELCEDSMFEDVPGDGITSDWAEKFNIK